MTNHINCFWSGSSSTNGITQTSPADPGKSSTSYIRARAKNEVVGLHIPVDVQHGQNTLLSSKATLSCHCWVEKIAAATSTAKFQYGASCANISSSRHEPQPKSAMKKQAGQTSIDTHPARAPEGKTRKTECRSSHSLYSLSLRREPPPLQAEREL